MKRTPQKYLSGLAVFVVLWVLIIGAVQIQLGVPTQIIAWLSRSPNPLQALIAFAALVSSLVVGAIRLGVDFGPFQPIMASERLKSYLTGLPLWFIAIVFAVSFAFLLLVPTCQPPATVFFEVNRQRTFSPAQTLSVKPGEIASVRLVASQEGDYLFCQWQSAGGAFSSVINANGPCEINLQFADKAADGFLTVLVRQNLCTQSAIFPLKVEVTP